MNTLGVDERSVVLTGEVLIASNAESIKGLISGNGGTTPHIRTNKLFARRDRSSLSLTMKDNQHIKISRSAFDSRSLNRNNSG